MSLKKLLLGLALFFFSLSALFSEKYFQISETELNQIQTETLQMMNSVKTLTQSVKELESQKNQYLELSNELRKENQQLQAKVKRSQLITLSVGLGVVAGGLTYIIFKE